MGSIIEDEWAKLYSSNSRMQRFAVCKESMIVWQTGNWNLVNDISELAQAPKNATDKVNVNGVTYRRISSSSDSYVATAENNQGHFLMASVDRTTWLLGWATPESIPELAVIDLARSAIRLKGLI